MGRTCVCVVDDDSFWVNSTQAARMMGVTIRRVYRLVDDGVLTAYRFGRVIRIKRSDLAAFIESCRIEPGAVRHLHDGSQDGHADISG